MPLLRTLALSALCAAPFSALAAPDTYVLDPMHTTVNWSINHFGFSNPTGKFSRVSGTLTLDEANPAASKVTATMDMKNLSTGLDELDKHIKSPDFFDADKFPTATFVSDSVTLTGKDTATVHGMLTLHGVTKPETLNVKLNKLGNNFFQKQTAGFTATTVIKRSDFGIDKYLPGLADEVPLEIESEANLPDKSPAMQH